MTKIYRGKRNGNRYLIIKRTADRHYMWKAEIHFNNGIVNPIGRKGFSRVHLGTIKDVLEDYVEVKNVEQEDLIRATAWGIRAGASDGVGVIGRDFLEAAGVEEKDWYCVVEFVEKLDFVEFVDVADEEIVITFAE